MELLTNAGSVCVAVLIFGLIKILWKKPRMFAVAPLITFAPLALIGLIQQILRLINPCYSTGFPQYILPVLSGIVVISFFFSSLLFVLISVGLLAKNKNDLQKSKDAKKHVEAGAVALILTVVIYFGFIVIIDPLIPSQLHNDTCLKIPTLQHLQP